MIDSIRVHLAGGISFGERARRCTIYENSRAFGALFTAFGAFAAYILFFRPDIHKEVNALIWIFRVVFPFGFGLAGLAMLGRSVRTAFDASRGTFVQTKTSLFVPRTRKGRIGEVKGIVLDARQEEAAARMESNRGRMRWRLTLSMDLGGNLVPLRRWSHTIDGNRPQNEGVVKAQEEAKRVARIVGRPLSLAWEKTSQPGAPAAGNDNDRQRQDKIRNE